MCRMGDWGLECTRFYCDPLLYSHSAPKNPKIDTKEFDEKLAQMKKMGINEVSGRGICL